MKHAHIAIDLGAESGRVILGGIAEGRLWTQDIHRFSHAAVAGPGGLRWDFDGLWRKIQAGLGRAGEATRQMDAAVISAGVDAWGVDYGLIVADGSLLAAPRCYRDPAFKAAFDRAKQLLSGRAIYEATGIQLMQFNTLFQLLLEIESGCGRLENARLAFIPDLIHFLMTGNHTIERTIASTSGMLDARRGTWARELLEKLGLPAAPLAEPIDPGTPIGKILGEVAGRNGLPRDMQVIAPASHDTASAVAAVPADMRSRWAYLSSGTWSLLGAEISEPCISEESFAANFTNELGTGKTVRFLKNISGLWLVQECRRCWKRGEGAGREFDYAELCRLAEQAPALRTLIGVNDPAFLAPADMLAEIQQFAAATGQPAPNSPGEIVRACLESLALEYARTLRTLESLLGRRFEVLHIVGGGAKNDLLNQWTADATGIPVLAGPVEATAIGNLLVQAMGTGEISTLAELRQMVRGSFPPREFLPRDQKVWSAAAERYRRLREKERE